MIIKGLSVQSEIPVTLIEIRDAVTERTSPVVKDYLKYAAPYRSKAVTDEIMTKLIDLGHPHKLVALLLGYPRISRCEEIALISNSLNIKLSTKKTEEILALLSS